jgi:hypothetical protein
LLTDHYGGHLSIDDTGFDAEAVGEYDVRADYFILHGLNKKTYHLKRSKNYRPLMIKLGAFSQAHRILA